MIIIKNIAAMAYACAGLQNKAIMKMSNLGQTPADAPGNR